MIDIGRHGECCRPPNLARKLPIEHGPALKRPVASADLAPELYEIHEHVGEVILYPLLTGSFTSDLERQAATLIGRARVISDKRRVGDACVSTSSTGCSP